MLEPNFLLAPCATLSPLEKKREKKRSPLPLLNLQKGGGLGTEVLKFVNTLIGLGELVP